MAERILVTGGAGYIGSVVADALLRQAYDVTVFDNLSHGDRAAVPKGAALAIGDVGDRAALDKIFQSAKFDAVMHFAAWIEAGESMQAPSVISATILRIRLPCWKQSCTTKSRDSYFLLLPRSMARLSARQSRKLTHSAP